jgi:hypothetical protein
MTRPDTLPDLTHRWQATSGPSYLAPTWQCPACLIASRAAFDALCPDRVLTYAREQYAAGYRDALASKAPPGAQFFAAELHPLSRDPSQPASQPAPDRRSPPRSGSPAAGGTSPDTDKEG